MNWGVRDLTVRYGKHRALRSITLGIDPGVIHAVVGGDGAGKSTLLRVVAGIGLDADGSVHIPARGRIGYVPSAGGVFGDLSVDENLEFVADAYRLSGWQGRASDLLRRAGLERFGDRLAGNLSGGQRRKLAGSMAMLPEPELLVLDELTTGVDPVSRMDLWRLIAAAASTGTGVIVATSYLDEAERAGQVLLLHDGRSLAKGPPTEIVAALEGVVRTVDAPPPGSVSWRRGSGWRQWDPSGVRNENDAVTLEDVAIVAELRANGAME